MKRNHKSLAHLAVLSAISALPLTLHAQQHEPDVVITATRIAQPLANTLAQTYVITRDDIAAVGQSSLAELLQRKAAVEIRMTGGAGQPAGVFMRGANAAHTLVLIDGQRISSATSGSTALENIALDMVERIEVVKGPLSSLYGSDAIGGVVQIFTRAHGEPRLTVEAGLGSQSARTFNAGFTTLEDKTNLTFNVGFKSVSPQSASNAQAGSFTYNPDRDAYRNENVVLKLSHTLWQGEKLDAEIWQSRGKTNYDAGATDNPVNEQTLSGIQLRSDNQIFNWWHSDLRLSRTVDDQTLKSTFGGHFETRSQQLAWLNDLTTPYGNVLLGVEQLDQTVSSSTAYTRNRRKTKSYFASLTETIGEQNLSASIRRDDADQYGKRNTGSISYGYRLFNDELIYVSAGRGFHAPSFNDLYFPGFSNPLLRPEKSRNTEFGYRLTRLENHFSLAVFDNEIEDLIVFSSVTSKPQNVNRARIQGWEASGDMLWNGVLFNAAFTAQRAKDVDSGAQLRSRAKVFGNVGVAKTLGKFSFGADVVASGARFDSSNASVASKMAGYAVIGAHLKYQIDKRWSLEMTGNNLANRKYQLAQGYNPPERSALLNVRFVAP